MDALQRTISAQLESLDQAIKVIQKADKKAEPKIVDGELLNQSRRKLKQRSTQIEAARKEAVADFDRQLKTLNSQIAGLERQAETQRSTVKDLEDIAKKGTKKKVVSKSRSARKKASKK